jgi:3-oxoacyl-(acyl-carrier-protein) synthase
MNPMIALSGLGCVTALPCPSAKFLKMPKSRKFMGGQDHLAVCAAGRALESAGLTATALGAKAGLFLAVGFIPFERADIDALIDGSLEGGRISLRRFGTDGFAAVNPLLTFRCLPNMPAYHVSANFDIQGEYFVTYPGAGEFYAALQEAIDALQAGRVGVALVGAVAHQTNFLVAHHHQRLRPPVAASDLRDGAGFLVLETESELTARGGAVRGRLLELNARYAAHDPFAHELEPSEKFAGGSIPDGNFGATSLPVALANASRGIIRHHLQARDGVIASSSWEFA